MNGKMKAIFFTDKNGAQKSFDKEFDSNKEALEYCRVWREKYSEREDFIVGEKNVAVKTDAVTSITIKKL